jgi:hypothetical protein
MAKKKVQEVKETKAIEIPNVLEKFHGIVDSDLLTPILPLIRQGAYHFANDGRVEVDFRMTADTPWVHVRQDCRRNCGIWHQVWFNLYGIIPSYCQSCWKVVARPTTLKELFQLYEIQVKLNRPSKCGIELRQSVGALYGGYFYNDTYELGLECFKEVKEVIQGTIGKHVNVFYKRACTEFEHKFGDSRNWEVNEQQKQLEARLESLFIDPARSHEQGIEIKRHVMAGWVRFAFAAGDKTAHEFMSQPLYPPYVKYGEE